MVELEVTAECLRDLTDLMRGRLSTQWCSVAAMTIVLYDYILTFADEVNFMWKSRWSIGKMLYFSIRYYTTTMIVLNAAFITTDDISQQVCTAWIQWHCVSTIVSTTLSEAVLMLRIYAMFGGRSSILVALLLSLAMTLVTACAIAVYIMLTEKITIHPFANINMSFCVALNLPKWFFALWIPFLVFETLMFSLALLKGYTSFRSRTNKARDRGKTLFDCLIQDSVLYFFVIFAAYLANLFVWVFANIGFIEIPIGFALALSSVLSQRMFLNMRNSIVGSAHTRIVARPNPDHAAQHGPYCNVAYTANGAYVQRLPAVLPLNASSIRDELRAI